MNSTPAQKFTSTYFGSLINCLVYLLYDPIPNKVLKEKKKTKCIRLIVGKENPMVMDVGGRKKFSNFMIQMHCIFKEMMVYD